MAKSIPVSYERAVELREMARQVAAETGDWRAVAQELFDTFDDWAVTTETPERVIFRKFPHNGEVIALFPDQYNERNGNIGSYMHNGQHAETAPDFGDTKPCESWADYGALYRELQDDAGYRNLRIVKRFGKLGK